MNKQICLPIIFLLSGIEIFAQNDCDPFTISAIEQFLATKRQGYVSFYKHESRKALAVNAAEYPGMYAIAAYTFNDKAGVYQLMIHTISETDGESSYRLLVNGELINEVQNVPTKENFVPQTLDLGRIQLKKGDLLEVGFNAHTNGKIPEGNSTAYSRGRWTGLKLVPVCP